MKRAIAMADNCIDVYYKLDRYYLTGNSIDFALNYRDLGGDVTEMTILGNDVFAMALEERLKERGIALRVLKRADRPTGMATMDIVDGDKKHLHFEGNAMEEIELSGEDLEFVKSFDIVYAERWSRIDRYIKELKQPGQIWVYDFSKRLEQEGNDLILPYCRLPRYLTKPRQRRSEWDMAGSDGISRVSAVFRGKSLLTNKMRII